MILAQKLCGPYLGNHGPCPSLGAWFRMGWGKCRLRGAQTAAFRSATPCLLFDLGLGTLALDCALDLETEDQDLVPLASNYNLRNGQMKQGV